MNALPKVVCSRTLTAAEWVNSTVARDVGLAVQAVKQGSSGETFVFGSANLGATLTRAGLIDEYRVLVNPVLLGEGRPLFPGVPAAPSLRLAGTRTFGNGNVLLRYRKARSEAAVHPRDTI